MIPKLPSGAKAISFLLAFWHDSSHLSDEDPSHPNEQKSLFGGPGVAGDPGKSCPDTMLLELDFSAVCFGHGESRSRAELTQMMVEMFVHENGPLLRIERTEKRVRVLRAACRAPGCEAVNCCDQLDPFALELAV